MDAVTGANHIGYQLEKGGKITFRSFDPKAGKELPTVFYQATPVETDRALQLAHDAAVSFAESSPLLRATLLERIAALLEQHSEQLIQAFTTESGLPADRAKQELKRTCFQLTTFAEAVRSGIALHAVIDTADPSRLPNPKPDLRKVNSGIGPVAVFGAGNFPFAYSAIGGDTGSALAAGCPVIVKGHPGHPHTSELAAALVVRAAKETGFPEGVFSHLHAIDHTVGEQLVRDHRIQAVGFTGSFRGGMALHKAAAERKQLIPVFAEMSSVNPVVILSCALPEKAVEIAEKVAQSVALNAGQFCTSPGLLFLVKSDHSDRFAEHLAGHLSQVPEQTMLNAGIKHNYESTLELQLEGARQLLHRKVHLSPSNTILPTLIAISGEQFIREEHRQDEVFGSFLQLVECSTMKELLDCLSVLRGQLTGSLFFNDAENEYLPVCQSVLSKKAGRIIFNGVPTGVEVSAAMHHGGVFPASTDSRFTAVGPDAIARFMRAVCYQNCPENTLPETLKTANPLGILRFVNGSFKK